MKTIVTNLLLALAIVGCATNSDSTATTSTTSTSSTTSSSSPSTTSGSISIATATLNGTTGCITNVNTDIGTGMPTWASSNFKCQVAYTSGTNYVFKSANLPNHASFYWCTAHTAGSTTCNTGTANPTLYASLPGGNTSAGTNVIAAQNFIYTIPQTPTLKSGALTSSQGGLSSIGITANGLAIFNNAAAPPDTLAVEATTFDSFGGHPQNTGSFHHHAAVTKLSATMNDSTLIGVALDGYLIYAEKCDNGVDMTGDVTLTAPTAAATGTSTADTGAGNGDSLTSLDKLHGHTRQTRHMTTATYHYHYAQDPTATIKTIMGSYFRGTIGSVSN